MHIIIISYFSQTPPQEMQKGRTFENNWGYYYFLFEKILRHFFQCHVFTQ
jgi:hypothetical protein